MGVGWMSTFLILSFSGTVWVFELNIWTLVVAWQDFGGFVWELVLSLTIDDMKGRRQN